MGVTFKSTLCLGLQISKVVQSWFLQFRNIAPYWLLLFCVFRTQSQDHLHLVQNSTVRRPTISRRHDQINPVVVARMIDFKITFKAYPGTVLYVGLVVTKSDRTFQLRASQLWNFSPEDLSFTVIVFSCKRSGFVASAFNYYDILCFCIVQDFNFVFKVPYK